MLETGFRLFFLAAGLVAVLAMFLWMLLYSFNVSISLNFTSLTLWHGHEMIFGYAMAVVAGFLLTAVRNWTGLPTLSGFSIFGLFCLWLIARIMPFLPLEQSGLITATSETVFLGYLTLAIFRPIYRAKQWHNIPIVLNILGILLSNIVFWLGEYRLGLYSAFYLTISLILVLGRRVIPFFIGNGVGYPVRLQNRKWVDQLCVYGFLCFCAAAVINPYSLITFFLSIALCLLHASRMIGWYTKGIWGKPLLWSLYISYSCNVLAFALYATLSFLPISPFLPLHLFAIGGVGLMTLSMMSRVSLAHTGRSIFSIDQRIHVGFSLILLAVIFRIVLPLIIPGDYLAWVLMAQILWICAFSLFLLVYAPVLTRRPID